jgi:hypothetical protein
MPPIKCTFKELSNIQRSLQSASYLYGNVVLKHIVDLDTTFEYPPPPREGRTTAFSAPNLYSNNLITTESIKLLL